MRPLGQLRRYLMLRLLHENIMQLGKYTAQELDENHIEILHIDQTAKDFRIQYRVNNKESQAIFMRVMLYSDIKAILQTLDETVEIPS